MSSHAPPRASHPAMRRAPDGAVSAGARGEASAEDTTDLDRRALELAADLVEARAIGFRTRANDDVGARHGGQQSRAGDFAQAALEAIPRDAGLLVLRHDESDPRMAEEGSDGAHLEMRGPKSLPSSRHCIELGAAREAVAPRKAEARGRAE